MKKLQNSDTPLPLQDNGPLLSNTETARILGVTPHYLDNLRYRKMGPAYIRLTQRKVMYAPRAVNEWMASHTVKGE